MCSTTEAIDYLEIFYSTKEGRANIKYIAEKFSKNLNYKIEIIKIKNKNIKSETDLLRLSNHKSKKYLKWHPKWNLKKTINKIIEWNAEVKKTREAQSICSKQILEYLKN